MSDAVVKAKPFDIPQEVDYEAVERRRELIRTHQLAYAAECEEILEELEAAEASIEEESVFKTMVKALQVLIKANIPIKLEEEADLYGKE